MFISFRLTAVFNVSKNSSQIKLTPSSEVNSSFGYLLILNKLCLQLFVASLDITNKKENVRVSCVNSIDRSAPPFVDYTTKRLPGKGVEINKDPEFLVCCDCTDDCQDKEKCQCWQLTIQVSY